MWKLLDRELTSRLLLGTAQHSSPDHMSESVKASGAEVVTVSLRRESLGGDAGQSFWRIVQDLGVHVLPNTAGCRSVKEAVTTAMMAREVFDTTWIKLEVIGDDYTLQPDPVGLVEAARQLVDEGFDVLPYMTDDLVLGHHLIDAGCSVLMPWAAPIGSGQGVRNPRGLATLRERLTEATLIVDAGLGRPSHAALVMEMGYDAVLLNSAVALAEDPVRMAGAFRDAVLAGRAGHEAGLMPERDMAAPSTPTVGTPFWHAQRSG